MYYISPTHCYTPRYAITSIIRSLYLSLLATLIEDSVSLNPFILFVNISISCPKMGKMAIYIFPFYLQQTSNSKEILERLQLRSSMVQY